MRVFTLMLFCAGVFMFSGSVALAHEPGPDKPAENSSDGSPGLAQFLTGRDALTDNWFGLGETLEERGITIGLGLTQVYQINLQGGGVTNRSGQRAGVHRRRGRYTGQFDLEMEFDLEKLFSLPGAKVFALAEGGWSEGLGPSSVGSVMDVNSAAYGDQVIDLSELYYEQSFLEGRVKFRIGKMDITGGYTCRHCDVAFDSNAFANDETAQFLNGALVNNPTIPFPDKGLAVSLYVEPVEGFYVAAGVADAQADARETGFNTAFHDEDYFFGVFETGLAITVPAPWGSLPGGYRAGVWYDPQDKERFEKGTTKRDDVGFYLTFDQYLYRENEQDDQGLGAFFRFGWADRDVSDFQCFWSTGLQYQGLVPGRDDDVLGLGYANGKFGDSSDCTAQREQAWELYYNAQLTPWMNVTPSLQFLKNPGGDSSVSDAVVAGVRVQLAF